MTSAFRRQAEATPALHLPGARFARWEAGIQPLYTGVLRILGSIRIFCEPTATEITHCRQES
jgi:hypothetical protein